MSSLLLDLLDRSLTTSRVRFELPPGTREVGRRADGPPDPAPDFVVRVTDRDFFGRIATAGTLGFAESYMAGGWSLERGALEDFLSALLLCRFRDVLHSRPSVGLRPPSCACGMPSPDRTRTAAPTTISATISPPASSTRRAATRVAIS